MTGLDNNILRVKGKIFCAMLNYLMIIIIIIFLLMKNKADVILQPYLIERRILFIAQ
ncbi:hypothetical protein Xsto_03747 [Xenorhabdus stockiae]|uniref:Uncharacterized protein n=1 Tax=Xenorhabdus stockiae TaxID=351614 RepID=A0A2D0KBA6_9GAMM|nr:hypothetical protein Xsto_03747 [Xenorhabdus stockiae]